MFKRVVFLVLVIILAKPVYETVSPLLKESAEVVVEVAETPMQVKTTTLELEEESAATKSESPGTVKSVEQLADAFAYYFSSFSTSFTIQYVGDTADLEKMLEAAVDDALARDTYIAGHLATREMQYEYTKRTATIHVTQSYLTTPQQEQEVEAVVKQVIADLDPSNMTDYEKVKFVNDYIVQQTVYSEQTTASPHSAYAVAYEAKGVCQGYALFAQKLLTTLGVESLYITGEVYTGGHAWNLVKVDGEWNHLDTTWNDPVPDRGTGVGYGYFLLNDSDMKEDHTWQSTDYPQAVSTKYRYLHQMQDAYEKDGYIYFSNNEDNNRLYRIDEATMKSERLGDVRALYIVGVGEWLYFSNYSNGAHLSRIKLDGSDIEVLYKEEVSNLLIEEGYIFFKTEEGNKKIPL